MSSADATGAAAAAPLPEPEPVSQDAFSGLIDRATGRLRSNSDLRLEIAQELRGHLQDSAAEYRAAGLSEAEADAKAVEAMGDPAALAVQLWQANRRRMGRRAVAGWAFGVLAAPVTVAVCFSLVWGVVTSLSLLTVTGVIGGTGADSRFPVGIGPGPARRAWERMVEHIPSEDRISIQSEEIGTAGHVFRIQQARAAAERWPTDPLLAANYVTQSLIDPRLFKGPQKTDRAALQELLMRADRGAAVEPNNGYYALIKAAALMDASARILDEPDDRKPKYDALDEHGKPKEWIVDRTEVLDPVMFEQGLAAFHEAAGKPYIDAHAMDVARRQTQQFPAQRDLSDYLLQTSFTISTLLPYLNDYRRAASLAGGYAITRAERDDAARAEAIVADEHRIGLLATASAPIIIEARVGQGITSLALAHAVVVNKLLGRQDAAARALTTLSAEEKRDAELRQRPTDPAVAEKARREAGLIQSATFYDPASKDLRPGRMAEYAAADEVALSVLVVALMLAAGARAALIGASAFARRRSATAPAARPFIGWRRVARIVLLGGAVPVLLYGVYCYLPVSGRGYGLPTTGPRVVMEYAAVAAVVAFLLRRLTERAVRQRLAELGLPATPVRGSHLARAVGVGLAIAVVVAVVILRVGGGSISGATSVAERSLALVLAIIAAAFAGVQLGQLRAPADSGRSPVAGPGQPIWSHKYRGSLIALLALLTAGFLVLALWEFPRRWAGWQPIFMAAALSCGLSMLGLAIFRFLSRLRTAARPAVDRPVDTPAALYRRALIRSAAVTYAATALVVGSLGAAVLRAQERHAVGQFDQAGYNFFDEVQRSRYRVVRDQAVAALRETMPSTLP